jgi:hypothetical protein
MSMNRTRAILVIRRAEVTQAEMRLGVGLLQRRDRARLAESGLAGDQNDLAVARVGAPGGASAGRFLHRCQTSRLTADPRDASNRLEIALRHSISRCLSAE